MTVEGRERENKKFASQEECRERVGAKIRSHLVGPGQIFGAFAAWEVATFLSLSLNDRS